MMFPYVGWKQGNEGVPLPPGFVRSLLATLNKNGVCKILIPEILRAKYSKHRG
jgi:hypothetical protein